MPRIKLHATVPSDCTPCPNETYQGGVIVDRISHLTQIVIQGPKQFANPDAEGFRHIVYLTEDDRRALIAALQTL